MKKLILAFALLSAPLFAAAALQYPVRVDVTMDDAGTKAKIISAASRELRKLGDIYVVADNITPSFILHIVAAVIKPQNGTATGYAFAVTVTYPGADPVKDKEQWVNSFVEVNAEIDEACRVAVAAFDTDAMAPTRQYVATKAAK